MRNHFSATLTRPYGGDDGTNAARLIGRVTAVLAIAAGVIHISAAGDHRNLPVMMAGFLTVATLQIALGALLWRARPGRLVIAAAAALMVGSVAIWLVSRTSGLPFLRDGHMEPVGFKDGICVLFELATLPGLLLLLSGDLARLTLPSPRLPARALGVVAMGTCALMTPALLLDGGGHHSHEEAVELGIHGHEADAGHRDSEPVHAGDRSAHGDGAAHGADGDRDAHARDGARSHAAGTQHTSGTSHSTQLASFHTGAGGGGHSPGAGGTGEHRQRDHSDRRGGRREHGRRDHGRTRHRERDRHRGGGKHDRDDPHEGHEDSEPDDGIVSDVCEVAAAVTSVC